MNPRFPRGRTAFDARITSRRGSVLITALLLAIIIAVGLGAYLSLSRTSLKLSQRTFFGNDALNLAEAGLEEAIYSFNQMGAGSTGAWTSWTISGPNAMRTLPPFDRAQNGVGIVKVFVRGYDGSNATPLVISQATITPFDGGAPVTKTLQYALKNNTGYSMNGIVALNGLTIKGQGIADSFDSNPTENPNGPWLPYSSAIARANTRVIVPAGTLTLGNGKVFGNLLIGPAVAVPPASQVTGFIQTNFNGTFKMPAPPTAAAVSQSYNLGAAIPAVLPAAGHLPAADGNYYYFCTGATVSNTTVPTGKNVVIVGTATGMGSGLTLQGTASCIIYIDGPVSCTGVINNGSWAGALRIFTTTSAACTIGNNGQIIACLYAPNAQLTASGGGNSGMLVGYFLAKTITTTGHMDFHYDEALQPLSDGNPWELTQWLDLQTAADRASVSTVTNNFLP
jgi:hypothetical protein